VTKEPGAWLTADMRSAIKRVLEHRHGIVPDDEDINWVSAAQESSARVQYESLIIRKLETLLVRRSQTTNHNHRASELLMEASGCYLEGLFDACIMVSRSAVEAALQTAAAKRGSLKELIAAASREGLLDDATAEMAHELRLIGNEFAHYDHQGILGHEDARVGQVRFVGDQPAECDRPALEALVIVNTVASTLAFKAYRHAVRICERLIPARPRSPATPG